MLVVSNTSPLSNLAIIGQINLLQLRYGSVRIPPAVTCELSALGHAAALSRINSAFAEGWLVVDSTPLSTPALPFPLDAGETEAIALALAIKAEVLLMDERRGREAARRNSLKVAGALGELLYAKQQGLIPNLKDEMKRLRLEAGFFVDSEIENFILSQAGE